ncbi:MAG: tRNA (guanine46-N7-)-methyltransferase (EC [uncultured Thiotrichaceae bacterium]|uniref:tRNA (guanine-N(7)-)-methyltransferase n=1 Tax=uncultured Thiotrichaceae bacterium TaxID=298394 RepID=A0A6S6U4V1_9GAMM|nr:MAG: tRNA (guanine46-N7-)-methyltransferase (EC [uncultured Thiotrichaceae bacterium]
MSETIQRRIRSFVMRQGRITSAQHDALERLWPHYGIERGDSVLDMNTLFPTQNPITLEVGFGNGSSLATMASEYPERNFIGIEVHRPGVGNLLRLIEEHQLSNVRVMDDDAVEILKHRVPNGCIDRFQLFFPDPWHKKKHRKRRIVQLEFTTLIAQKLVMEGIFHMATDWKDYARHMEKVMEAAPDFTSISDTPFSPRPDYRPLTKFEDRGLKLGHGVWDLIYKKV